jgi:Icc-related predicted phosphoesterase
MVRVCAISDWHGNYARKMLPQADLYVACGDMLPNDPCALWKNLEDGSERVFPWSRTPTSKWMYVHRVIVREHEEKFQRAFIERHRGKLSDLIPNKEAPIVFVQGNHDFVEYGHLFDDDAEVHELTDPGAVLELTIDGRDLRIGGAPGINYIHGEWNWEMHKPEQDAWFAQIPSNIDLLVTHAPPFNMLDYAGGHYGCRGISRFLERAWTYHEAPMLRGHCFGHIHEQGGGIERIDHSTGEYMQHAMTFANAAETFVEFEI